MAQFLARIHMEIVFHKNFKKQYQKLPKKVQVQVQFVIRLELFIAEPNNPILHVHQLHGEDSAYTSMNVTADYRALFIEDRVRVTFYKIGSHSELYS